MFDGEVFQEEISNIFVNKHISYTCGGSFISYKPMLAFPLRLLDR